MKRVSSSGIEGGIRIVVVALMILFHLGLVLFLFDKLRDTAVWAYAAVDILLVLTMVIIVCRNKNNSYTVAWILLIALFSIVGFAIYVIWGRADTNGLRNRRIRKSIAHGQNYLKNQNTFFEKFAVQYPDRRRIPNYLLYRDFPIYQDTSYIYYPIGELQFEDLIKDLEKAERFIFLQTFILSEGKLWDRIEKILVQKAKDGIDVRLLFDDFGSAATFSLKAALALRKQGVQIVRFNSIHKYTWRLSINFRSHQKIAVIDGNIAYTGGTNIADEYVNYYEKHGHWKDTAIRIEGEAVWSMTVIFLQMWDVEAKVFSEYEKFRPVLSTAANTPDISGKKIISASSEVSVDLDNPDVSVLQSASNADAGNDVFFQPFSDGPVNNPDNPAEAVYREMITSAQDYLYITTPYLIIDNTMTELLCATANAGVDVRIILPRIWDKWYVRDVSRSGYAELLKAGVKIYEYIPGFIHSKMVISDDLTAVIGTINMDYRSFYHHFENGVWICGADVVMDIKKDMLDTFEKCEEITLTYCSKLPVFHKICGGVLRVFAVVF